MRIESAVIDLWNNANHVVLLLFGFCQALIGNWWEIVNVRLNGWVAT